MIKPASLSGNKFIWQSFYFNCHWFLITQYEANLEQSITNTIQLLTSKVTNHLATFGFVEAKLHVTLARYRHWQDQRVHRVKSSSVSCRADIKTNFNLNSRGHHPTPSIRDKLSHWVGSPWRFRYFSRSVRFWDEEVYLIPRDWLTERVRLPFQFHIIVQCSALSFKVVNSKMRQHRKSFE